MIPRPFPSPAACLLVTENEVGADMKEPVTASANDPLGDPLPVYRDVISTV
jgi:hypothetical protein